MLAALDNSTGLWFDSLVQVVRRFSAAGGCIQFLGL